MLPPFSDLTTDEDRERKAELSAPGTYHVITNVNSFASLPEYRDDLTATDEESLIISHTRLNSDNVEPSLDNILRNPDDPNVIILKDFEDFHTTLPYHTTATQFVPAFFHAPVVSNRGSRHSIGSNDTYSSQIRTVSMLDIARQGGKDADLLQHYRQTMSHKITEIESTDGDEDMFEAQARNYPPVHSHAFIFQPYMLMLGSYSTP